MNGRHEPTPDVLTQREVCARLGISDDTWARWRAAQKTPDAIVMPSGRLKWRTIDIDRLTATTIAVEPRRRYFGSVSRAHAATVAPFVAGRTRKTVAGVGR